MGLFNIIIIVVLAIAGGAISFGAYKLKQRFSRGKADDSEAQETSLESGLDPDVPFPDLVDSVTFETPPAPPVDISSEFASLHKSLREIAKAQVSIIESGQSGEDGVEASKLEDALNSLKSVKDETQSLIEGVSERLEKMSEQLASSAETGEAQPQNTEFLELLEQIAARPDAPELSAISDLLLPQIALLGEDVTRLAAQVDSSSTVMSRMENVEALLQDILEQNKNSTPAPVAETIPAESISEQPAEPESKAEQEDVAPVGEDTEEEMAASVESEPAAGNEINEEEPKEEPVGDEVGEREVEKQVTAEPDMNGPEETLHENETAEGEAKSDQIDEPEPTSLPEPATEPEKAKGVSYIPAGETEPFEADTDDMHRNRLSV